MRRRHIPGFFIRGPLPLDVLARAAQLPGKALPVVLIAFFLRGMKPEEPVRMQRRWLAVFGVSRYSLYRALKELEKAGVCRVAREGFKVARVELLEGGDVR